MTTVIQYLVTIVLSCNVHAESVSKKANQAEHQHKSSVYTDKIKQIANAISLSSFTTDLELRSTLKVSCERRQCNELELQTIDSVGQQMIHCQINHLKAHGIINEDAKDICGSKQAIFGCDSLSTPLLRKMCYTGNKYSLQIWQQKETQFSSRRMPASEN